MTAELDLDRRLERWFAEDAPAHAPDRVLTVSMEIVGTMGQRRGLGVRVTRRWEGLSPRQRVILVLATMLLALGAAVAVGALAQRLDNGGSSPGLVLVHPTGTAPDYDGGLVVEVRTADGSTRELARYTADQLGGHYAFGAAVPISRDGYLAVPISLDGGRSSISVVDLRGPSAAARLLDAEGMMSSWGPSGKLALMTNDGGFAAYDAATGVTTPVTAPGVAPLEVAFRPSWSIDGSGVAASGGDGAQTTDGILRTDGSFAPGPVPLYQDGIGPRRVAADGSRLRCNEGDDSGCYEPDSTLIAQDATGSRTVWAETLPGEIIADFAWTAKGDGVWALMESAAPGPRTERLVRVGPDGIADEIATWSAAADDPDPNSYSQGASFAGFSPDDDRVVITVNGPGGSFGALHVVDPSDGSEVTSDAWVAGWLPMDWLETPRPTAARVAETDAALRGAWSMTLDDRVGSIPSGPHRLVIKRTSATIDAGFDQVVPLVVEGDGTDGLIVTQPDAAIGCDAGSSARYRWVLHGGALRLTALDDPCAGRAVLLGTEFEPALPYPDTGSVLAEAGRAYVVPDFGVPFRMLTPTGSVTYVEVHREDEIWFTGAAPGNDPSESVSIGVIDGAPANACERHGEKQAIDPGMAGAIAHLESLADQGLRAASRTEATVGGLPAARFEIDATRVPATCASGVAPWMVGGYPLFVRDGSVITLVEPVPGTVVVIAVRPPDAASAPSPWAESLVGSIEFQPAP